MTIYLTTGQGTGKTQLSAFDSALQDAGVYNYNLITLSSVIPPNTTVIQQKYVTPEKDYGHRLYVVKAEHRSQETGKYIGAAIGWYQLPDGRGVFVEHEAEGSDKNTVERTLKQDVLASLSDLCIHRNYPPDEKNMHLEVNVTQVTTKPTSVLVLAVYTAEAWDYPERSNSTEIV